jgi:acyl phosphate:glycerol-3-phosphate acyltransferase
LIQALLSVAIAYLLGSVSSACIVGRLAGNIDIRDEPDGCISAATIYYRIGKLPYLAVVLMDISLAAVAVMTARTLTHSPNMMMISGFVAVAGHNWSIFLKLKGGLGATAIGGTLAVVMPWQLFYGLITAVVVLLLTQKPGLSTGLGIIATSGIIFIQKGDGMLAMYPLALFMLMLLKKLQVGRTITSACQENTSIEKTTPNRAYEGR